MPDVLSRRPPRLALRGLLVGCAALGLVSVVSSGSSASAADAPLPPAPPAVELPLKAGTSLVGVVESADGREVVLVVGPQSRRRVPLEQLAPLGRLRVAAALTAPDDGPGRLALAARAMDLELFAEARAEMEKAQALGAIDAAAARAAIADAERRAVDAGLSRAQRAADAGDIAGALEAHRELELHFPGVADPKRLAALAARIAARDVELRRAMEEAETLALDVERKRELLRRLLEAKKQRGIGDERAAEAVRLFPGGNVTRVGRAVEAADEAYGDARRQLGRLRRIVRKDESEREQVLALLGELDGLQFRNLLGAAKFFWDARVYARADAYATRASYLDPVDPTLLELRESIRAHRIRYRFSDVTNARPR